MAIAEIVVSHVCALRRDDFIYCAAKTTDILDDPFLAQLAPSGNDRPLCLVRCPKGVSLLHRKFGRVHYQLGHVLDVI